jgi:hypothetical protein
MEMTETIRIALFTLVGISAIFSVIKEFQKPEKRKFWITFEAFSSARSNLDVNRTSHITYIISTLPLNKTKHSFNNVYDIRFSPCSPWRWAVKF